MTGTYFISYDPISYFSFAEIDIIFFIDEATEMHRG